MNKLSGLWENKLNRLLQRSLGQQQGEHFWQKYHALFAADYQQLIPVRYALRDILQIEQMLAGSEHCVELFPPFQQTHDYRLHFYSAAERYLDEYIPVLDSMGFRLIDQVQFVLNVDGLAVYIKSFAITLASKEKAHIQRLKPAILSAIKAILAKQLETDTLNRLIVSSGLQWQAVDVLRAYRNYYLQLGLPSSMASFDRALIRNPLVAKSLFCYFEMRFRPDPQWQDPSVREEFALFPARMQLLENIEKVSDINDDRILRTVFNLLDATVRSNFHVRRQQDDYFIAFKINSLGVIDMLAPRPQFEIYVHAFDMQGIHLRGGEIARGGIRWSDRPDDFRTEILGLMQTQMSKNALIIPKGAKGGFVVKQTFTQRDDFLQAGKQAYMKLMRGLLDLTDNYVKDEVVRLPGIVTYDANDPYLVVAADKGTASFPDIANQVAQEYQFWLHDAFASGGSAGYNHKSLGITARGAWESVKRHFRELGKDIQHQAFTVVGIGSMDGDVFGNAMLLSHCTQLLAAISGQHIFIDPEPDPELSYAERKRLFDLPGSSWADYNPQLISEGGGVYLRSAKNIPVSLALKKWLGIRYRSLDGESLVHYLLSAPVELLWLGGIGTYVKASTETHEQVGDRLHDRVRTDALNIHAQVVGEGANLGFTQKARIQYSIQGGLINTDAIDNSAGVDISDHEVNLKILLRDLDRNKLVDNPQQLFNAITDDVCGAVLHNNYQQSQCLSLDCLRCSEHFENFMLLSERLQAAGLLDLQVESFPTRKDVLSRNYPLTRPELAVLLAAAKLYLKQILLEQGDFIKADYCTVYLQAYFPEKISHDYTVRLAKHPLADNIKATWVSNYVLNQAGCTFLNAEGALENGKIVNFVGCYLTFDHILQGTLLRKAISALDNKVASDVQYSLLLQLEKVLYDFCYWVIANGQSIYPDEQTLACYSRYLSEYETYFFKQSDVQEPLSDYQHKGVSEQLAQRFLFLTHLQNFPFMVKLSLDTEQDFVPVWTLFNEITAFLGLDKIKARLLNIPLHNQWDRSVLRHVRDGVDDKTGALLKDILKENQMSCADYFSRPQRVAQLKHFRHIHQAVCSETTGSLLPYIVLLRALADL